MGIAKGGRKRPRHGRLCFEEDLLCSGRGTRGEDGRRSTRSQWRATGLRKIGRLVFKYQEETSVPNVKLLEYS